MVSALQSNSRARVIGRTVCHAQIHDLFLQDFQRKLVQFTYCRLQLKNKDELLVCSAWQMCPLTDIRSFRVKMP